MENLIAIIIFIVGTIVYNMINRKREDGEMADEDRSSAPPPPPSPYSSTPPPRPSPAANWEENLRRFLQGDPLKVPSPAPSPPPPPAAPPRRNLLRPETSTPAPPPLPYPNTVRSSRPAAPRPTLAHSNIPVPEEGHEMEVGLAVAPVSLHQAASAHERAQVAADVTQRMRATATRVTGHVGNELHAARITQATRVRLLLRHRESVQAAVVASVLLGPPRAMEPFQ
jgi:hypothetical protein